MTRIIPPTSRVRGAAEARILRTRRGEIRGSAALRTRLVPGLPALLSLAGALFLLTLGACDDAEKRAAQSLTGGDVRRGHAAIAAHGCGSCHTIPGVRGADGLVGPPLTSMGSRAYVGGVMKNTPQNLVKWIQDPPAIDPQTAMPKLGVSEADARDIASYLYTLR